MCGIQVIYFLKFLLDNFKNKLQCSYDKSQIWGDTKKATANEKKHGISFEEARSVFFDENAKLINDPDHSDDEERCEPWEKNTISAKHVRILTLHN